MSSNDRISVLLPTGRMVQGDLYKANTTDAEGKPLVVKTGPNAGTPRTDFYFAVAIPKNGTTHWNQTDWGRQIDAHARKAWPNGQCDRPDFAWKITDGDSQVPNKAGKKPCDMEGFPGHWVVRLSSGFAPKVVNRDGSAYILEEGAVNAGDFVQVLASVGTNGSSQQAGIYINHQFVSLQGYGERIENGPDPKAIGFGGSALPPGASSAPVGAMTPPAAPPAAAAPPPPPAAVAPPPDASFTKPPRVMLPAANGASYESYIQAGWTDELLIQHGLMQA